MSDDLTVDDEPYGAPGEDDQFREMRRAANKSAKLSKENAALTTRIADLERQVALSSAGLTLSPKQQAALLAAHEGELERDQLRATAAELGFITPDSTDPDPDSDRREAALQTQAKISAAAQGTIPPAPLPKLDEQIMQAQQAGDHKRVMQLKASAALMEMRKNGSALIS